MSGFTRPAPWLRQLFTSSRTGSQSPANRSDDVSLIQPYDGGGYPSAQVGVAKCFFQGGVATPAAAGGEVFYTCPANTVVRVVGLGVALAAGNAPTSLIAVSDETNTYVPITGVITPVTNDYLSFGVITCPILTPGMELELRWYGGSATTDHDIKWAIYSAPIGSVFYV